MHIRPPTTRVWVALLVSGACLPASCGWGEVVTLGGGRPEETGGLFGQPPAVGDGGTCPGSSGGTHGSGGAGTTPPTDTKGGSGGRCGGDGSGDCFGGAGPGGAPGEETPPGLVAVAIRPLTDLNTEFQEDNPTLTSDELMICFTSKREPSTGGLDMWCAERDAPGEIPFGEPVELAPLNTTGFESSPALSLDGLTLWFASDIDDQVDIYASHRPDRTSPWGPKERSSALSSTARDIPRPTALGNLVMPLSSQRDAGHYWTYLATRDTPGGDFGTPQLLQELAYEDHSVVDAFLREDGLTLIYKLQPDGSPGDLYHSHRASLDEPFGEPVEVRGINSDADERDPWLSLDGRRLYFSSDRSGQFDLYVAEIEQ